LELFKIIIKAAPKQPVTRIQDAIGLCDVDAQLIEKGRIQKRYGRLQGLLADEFEEWLER
jgi:hypothetical protein